MKPAPTVAAEPLSEADLNYYHHMLDLYWHANGLAHVADSIRHQLDRFDRSRLPSTPGSTGVIPWHVPSGFVPRGSRRMGQGVSKATGKAQEELEYGIERHTAALGR